MFNLHPAFLNKAVICDLPLCRVFFEDNAAFPWVILVPRKNDVKNMLNLTTDERLTLMREIEICERAMDNLYHPTQTNVAMIGNKTPQLHVHIICRFEGDMAWPETVWHFGGKPYSPAEKEQQIHKIQQEILSCQKLLS